jgi:adenylyltransferase/sulfurtransferase
VLGAGESLVGRLVVFDALRLSFRQLALRKDPDCPVCGYARPSPSPSITRRFCGIGGQDAGGSDEISRLSLPSCSSRRGIGFRVLDVREPWEWRSPDSSGLTSPAG